MVASLALFVFLRRRRAARGPRTEAQGSSKFERFLEDDAPHQAGGPATFYEASPARASAYAAPDVGPPGASPYSPPRTTSGPGGGVELSTNNVHAMV